MATWLWMLLLIGAFWAWRNWHRLSATLVAPEPDTRWHAVSVECGAEPCVCALNLRTQRFLSEAAPALPLAQCDGRNCHCGYHHFNDRRQGPRRRALHGTEDDQGIDRRLQVDRRRALVH